VAWEATEYIYSVRTESDNAGIKSLRATLPAEIFTGDFVSLTVHFINICLKIQKNTPIIHSVY
jgi:hypothetical protein